jgi:hypothetical protein
MYQYRISIFYKQQPEQPTATQLLNPATLRPGDEYVRVFRGERSFSNGSDENVLQELFATFNGHGQPLPDDAHPIPRSMGVGDIITGEEALAFLVTETGFERLAFAPRGQRVQLTQALLSHQLPANIERVFHPLHATED